MTEGVQLLESVSGVFGAVAPAEATLALDVKIHLAPARKLFRQTRPFLFSVWVAMPHGPDARQLPQGRIIFLNV